MPHIGCDRLTVSPVSQENVGSLAQLFELLRATGAEQFFHPHPLTLEAALDRARHKGKDQYFVLLDADQVLGYGMLRGWDEGFDVPSLGIVVHPNFRGRGLGRFLMELLHREARKLGAKRIRLRVHPENHAAMNLYRSLGYKLEGEADQGDLVGCLQLC